ncbi:FAD:protein FMN transferase [Kutzneria sp. NPDC051319]|uniref:FAD:protein FMN transferase n=1 Tax=Kutzneria sp. NPDC051319 TaxID=3155047 RepID=UPI003427994B
MNAPVNADEWAVWSTTARVVVTEPETLAAARVLVESMLSEIDLACSRFRPDSELMAAARSSGPVRVSPLLATLVEVALKAAEDSGGAVDPTVGSALCALGYDRDLSTVDVDGVTLAVTVSGWRSVKLTGNTLTVPKGVVLDLGATAKAFAADCCARLVADALDTGVLVSLGGDIATAGPAPANGWQILVQDRADDPSCVITMPADKAIATSSTRSRQWRRGDRLLHHILDPGTGQPAPGIWRCVTVVADHCADANTLTTAALVKGHDALALLRAHDVPARLVAADGSVRTLGGWP